MLLYGLSKKHELIFFFLVSVMKKESAFQLALVKKLRSMDCVVEVIKNDANYIQGFPDLTVYLRNGKWAMLECKREDQSSKRPNQPYYIRTMNACGFARFIEPGNEEEVLRDLCQYAS